MSKDRSHFTGQGGAPSERRRLWVAGAVGTIGLSGLILGMASPVSADDVSAGGDVGVSVGVEGDCVSAGTGADGATDVSVCGDDLEGIGEDLPPTGPDDLEGAVPGDPAGLFPEGFGLDPEIMSRLARVLPGLTGVGPPGGTDVDRPTTITPGSERATPPVVGGASDEGRTAPDDHLVGSEIERVTPGAAGAATAPAVATLPRTGPGLEIALLRLLAFAAAGRAVLGLGLGRRRS